ncbi:MAG: hypothetical protein WBB29_12260 [Geitlerinemataceae cyanobacterium]
MKKLSQLGISVALVAFTSVTSAVFSAPASAQPIGERPGDVCRRVDIMSNTELFLYENPDTSSGAIVAMFDGEQINLITPNVAGTDGAVYHEIEDSAGNRGYILATDNSDGSTSIVNCTFAPFW